MYKFNKNLFETTRKFPFTYFIFIPALVIFNIWALLNLNNTTGNEREACIGALFMCPFFLFLILRSLLVPRKLSPLTKKILNPEIDKLLAEGKTLEAVILDNSVEFRGLMYVAVQSSGNNYIATPFAG